MKELQIGDKVRVSNWFNNHIVTITRVTKTLAEAPLTNTFSFKFKRQYLDPSFLSLKVNFKWDQTRYELIS